MMKLMQRVQFAETDADAVTRIFTHLSFHQDDRGNESCSASGESRFGEHILHGGHVVDRFMMTSLVSAFVLKQYDSTGIMIA